MNLREPTCQHCRPAESQHAAVEGETGGDSAPPWSLAHFVVLTTPPNHCGFFGCGTGHGDSKMLAECQEEHSRLEGGQAE